ncbi:hypothetical protein V2J09_013693 [Rumex salicifolius]
MAKKNILWTWGVVMLALVAAAAGSSETPASADCLTTLAACQAPVLDPTLTPSPLCCTPLKNVVKTQTACICQIINDPTLLYTYNVTTDQIFNLTTRCNIADASPSMCSDVPTSSPGIFTPAPPGKNSGSTYDVVAWSGIALILAVMATLLF